VVAATVGAALLAGALRRAVFARLVALDGAAFAERIVPRVAPLVVAEAVDRAGLAVAEAGAPDVAGAAAGAAAVAGGAGAGAAGAAAAGAAAGGGAPPDAGGGGDDGVPKPGAVQAQAMLTPITAAPSTDKTETAIKRVRLATCTTPFPFSCFSRRGTVAQPDTRWEVFVPAPKSTVAAHPAR